MGIASLSENSPVLPVWQPDHPAQNAQNNENAGLRGYISNKRFAVKLLGTLLLASVVGYLTSGRSYNSSSSTTVPDTQPPILPLEPGSVQPDNTAQCAELITAANKAKEAFNAAYDPLRNDPQITSEAYTTLTGQLSNAFSNIKSIKQNATDLNCHSQDIYNIWFSAFNDLTDPSYIDQQAILQLAFVDGGTKPSLRA